MKWSWKIARFWGIDIYMHATFLLIVLWVAFSYWVQFHNWDAVLGGIAFILALFVCVVLHEYGHALTARRFGVRTRALTPVTAEPAPFAALAGVSLTASLVARDAGRSARARGGFLFTHRGYSGPAVLDVSHVLVRSSGGARLMAQWTALDAEGWERALRGDGARGVVGVVRGEMPARLADLLVRRAGIDPETNLSQLRRADRVRLVEGLARCELPWTGHGGYAKAEVTGGGVSLAEIDPRTMESRKAPGLYVCGEVLDAFGPIGGYNFLWAWATGRAAGLGATRGN